MSIQSEIDRIQNEVNAQTALIEQILLELETVTNPDDGDVTIPVAVNSTTNVEYSDVQAALKEALDGETINLLENVSCTDVMVPTNVTLNLNGFNLQTDRVYSLGNVVDHSEENTGLLKVLKENFLIQNNNSQLPVKDSEGYRFYEVIKFNEQFQNGKFYYQPFVEPNAHPLLKLGSNSSGIVFCIRLIWRNNLQDFVNDDSSITNFLNSYNASKGTYSLALNLTLNGLSNYVYTIHVVVKSDLGVEFVSNGVEYDNTNVATAADYQDALAEMGVNLDG